MKNLYTYLTCTFLLSTLLSISAQTPTSDAVQFTSAEGYVDGELGVQTPTVGGWTTNSNGFTVNSLTGLLTLNIPESSSYRKARFSNVVAATETSFTIASKFSFSRVLGGVNSNKQQPVVAIGFSDVDAFNGGRLYIQLDRHKTNETYRLSFGETTGSGNTFEKTGYVAESLLGFGDNDADSDDLWMTMTVTKGADATSWSANIALTNMSTGTEIATKTGISFDTNDAYFTENLFPVINSSNKESVTNTSNRIIKIFDASPLTDTSSLSIIDNNVDNSFSIYPNPVKDILHVDSDNEFSSIEIYSISGKLVKNCQFNDSSLNVSELALGVYILKCIGSNPKSSVNTKFVKS